MKLNPILPSQVAEEVLKYPTSIMPRRWQDLAAVKSLFFKRAESLGTDGGDAGYSVNHAQRAADHPLHTLITTGALNTYMAYSYGLHDVARGIRLPAGVATTKLVFEARARLAQTVDCSLSLGFNSQGGFGPSAPHCGFYYTPSESANFRTRSYQSAAETADTGVAANTEYHVFHIEISASKIEFYIDGALVATHTTQIPNAGLPNYMDRAIIWLQTLTAAAKSLRYEYVAVWVE